MLEGQGIHEDVTMFPVTMSDLSGQLLLQYEGMSAVGTGRDSITEKIQPFKRR